MPKVYDENGLPVRRALKMSGPLTVRGDGGIWEDVRYLMDHLQHAGYPDVTVSDAVRHGLRRAVRALRVTDAPPPPAPPPSEKEPGENGKPARPKKPKPSKPRPAGKPAPAPSTNEVGA